MGSNGKKSLANPTTLKPIDKDDGCIQVIVETPSSSRNKYAYDPKQGIFTLKAVLPAGMVFPHDFGFVPRTIGGDGDPVDVLLLLDTPVFPGCAVKARAVGVIQGEQIDGKDRIRNDRIVAISDTNHLYANIKHMDDLPKKWIKEVEVFFVNYHNLEGKRYKLLGCKGPGEAMRLIQKAQQAA